MGKSGGKGILPPTNPKRRTDPTKTHLRDQRTIKRLKMYTSRIQRNEKGDIIKGSVLKASDRVSHTMARIAPDRRWFGNTRVIGQEALQKFREEMSAKYRDPYSIIIKQSKLPLSLLEEPKGDGSIRQEMNWDSTFGDKATRKRVRLNSVSMDEMAEQVKTKGADYLVVKDRNLLASKTKGSKENVKEDKSQNQKLFRKGQSNRIWNELYKVVDSADVILYVLDARDPMGTRSPFLEDYMRREKKYKHFVFVLNKCDLIPLWASARWLQILSKDYPTISFHASVNHPFGKGNLISLLRQFNKLHNVTHRGNSRTKTPISVGIVGYPNVGKSSLINTLRRKAVCKVAPIPGETKVWQYVALTKSIFLIDCPGIVYDREGNNDTQAILKGVVRVERLGSADKTLVLDTVLQIVKKKDIINTYGVPDWRDVNDFLTQLAKIRGKLLQGGVPDLDTVSRAVLYDWQRGKLPWFNAPPFESNQNFRDAMDLSAAHHMKFIENYSSFNIIDNDRLEITGDAAEEAEEGSDDSDNSEEKQRVAEGLLVEEDEGEVDESSSSKVGKKNSKICISQNKDKAEKTNKEKKATSPQNIKKAVSKNEKKKANNNDIIKKIDNTKNDKLKEKKGKNGLDNGEDDRGHNNITMAQFMEEEELRQKKHVRQKRRKAKLENKVNGITVKAGVVNKMDSELDALWSQFMNSQ